MAPHRTFSALSGPLALALFLAAAPAAHATQSRDAAVGADGELFIVRAGDYGELFPEGGLADPANPALALEIAYPGRETQVLLVPGTEMGEVEKNASLLFEDETGTLFLLWQTEKNGIHSWLNLIGFHDGDWTEPIEITGSPFGWKSSPQLAITRDTYQTEEDGGGTRTWSRTTLHLLWSEGGSPAPRILYSPIVLLNGEYLGWNPVYSLDELALAADEPLPTALNLALAEAPRIQPGRNNQSVQIGFVLTPSNQFVTLEIELLPGELGALADAVRAQIVDLGRTGGPDGGDGHRAIAGKVRAQIVDLGRKLGLHPGLSTYMAESVGAEIEAMTPDTPPARIADEVRAQIVDLGSRMTGRGFERRSAAQGVTVLEVSNDPLGEVLHGQAPSNFLRVRQASVRPAPTTGPDDNAVFLSREGGVIVAWVEDDAVYYRESQGDSWSAPRRLRLDSGLDLDRAWQILERRAEERSSAAQ